MINDAEHSQAAFAVSKSAVELPEQCVKTVKVNKEDIRTGVVIVNLIRFPTLFWCIYT